ncbi:S-layer homology domain-containing protein [Paenibacillus woosongensis]|uniref:S-layer homology domain-containing protein n=1 Tax=Paenibacillus woosongensis TaxID=307580 RepID=A0AA95IC35_9BACL|nr:S-layer homology domain-containing protein [Paenibacillus woosongensis]WHX51184.1 S-layer homology domain-containing protein [Paenibacillus woosongensis]
MMNPKLKLTAALLLSSSLLLASSAAAFQDVEGRDAAITKSLHERGIIHGMTKEKFAPKSQLTGAQGVRMIVQALDLKGKSKASPGVKGGAAFWYSESLQIAKDNGIQLPADFKPNEKLSREAFANMLMQGVAATGDYPVIMMYVNIADSDQVNPDYMSNIQTLLLTKIASLDDDGKFHPKTPITRIEAARLVYQAAEFVRQHKDNVIPGKDDDQQLNQVSYQTVKVNDQVNKVVLTRANQPHPGYGIAVAKIEFKARTAVVYYELLSPDPGKFYPQVITDSKTETYVSSQYEVVIKPLKK